MLNISEEIKRIIKDIKDVKVQGATNVAYATLGGIEIWINSLKENDYTDKNGLIADFEKVGNMLSTARPNEPLAENAVKYIKYRFVTESSKGLTLQEYKTFLIDLCNSYRILVKSAKDNITNYGTNILKNVNIVLTHCHSSTAEDILKNVNKLRKDSFEVVSTETRPLYQGRITSTNLLKAGVKTTMITDSAIASFILDDTYMPVDAIIIGADQINVDGSAINKVGSLSIALAASVAGKPLYIVCPVLKIDTSTAYKSIEIEVRNASEVWSEAPEGLNIINPAFELINKSLITAYITEFGIVNPNEIYNLAIEKYQWLT